MIEQLILQELLYNEPYTRKVIPYLHDRLFTSRHFKIVFRLAELHLKRYNKLPTKDSLLVDLGKVEGLTEQDFKDTTSLITSFEKKEDVNYDWMVKETETFVQDRSVFNAVKDSLDILDGKNKKLTKGAIPQLLATALGVSFDSSIGHDYLNDWEKRFNVFHDTASRLPFDLEFFNKATKGGLKPKTLNVVLAGTGVGKTAFMCHMAAQHLLQGKNVLYITLEMAEEYISQRIDANLFDITMDEVEMLPKDAFQKKIERQKAKTKGQIIVKEYANGSAGADHFRHLIQELKLKKNFKPHIIYVDYLNICASSRLKMGGQGVNSYAFVKAIAEELRALGQELNIPIFSGTQVNRTGFSDSDVGMESTSESFGLPMTVDLLFALITSDELEALGQVLCKQLKSRYADINKLKRFVIGYDKAKMRFFDVEQSAQSGLMDETVLFDVTKTGERIKGEKFGGIS